eukprot:1161199-Pelagomonas_calceolata.AAC.2
MLGEAGAATQRKATCSCVRLDLLGVHRLMCAFLGSTCHHMDKQGASHQTHPRLATRELEYLCRPSSTLHSLSAIPGNEGIKATEQAKQHFALPLCTWQ